MTVRRGDNGSIVLDGSCPVEDAEPLLQMLQASPAATCDWTRCNKIHTAVVQVLLAARPALIGPCGDPWVQRWVETRIPRSSEYLTAAAEPPNGVSHPPNLLYE
jgi:hypothetical protein